MCEPTTIAAGMMLAGTLVGAAGQYEQGQYGAAISRQNARVADIRYRDSLARGVEDEAAVRRDVAAFEGAQRARIGGSGVELSGTPLDMLTDTATLGDLDARRARSNAAREAWGFQQESRSERARGRMYSRAGTWGAAGTLLTGGSQAYGMWKTK